MALYKGGGDGVYLGLGDVSPGEFWKGRGSDRATLQVLTCFVKFCKPLR